MGFFSEISKRSPSLLGTHPVSVAIVLFPCPLAFNVSKILVMQSSSTKMHRHLRHDHQVLHTLTKFDMRDYPRGSVRVTAT